MKEFLSEIIVSILLVAVATAFINPYWMPMGIVSTLLFIFAGLFVAFVIFIWKEKRGDERETYLRNIAGRVGYLVGALFLVIGIICEIIKHNMVNGWLIATLVAMIVAKIVGLIWAKRKY